MARWLIWIGVLLIIIGALLHFIPGLFRWFGHLPGDIRIEGQNSKVFIPITSMIVISLILTLFINFIQFLKK